MLRITIDCNCAQKYPQYAKNDDMMTFQLKLNWNALPISIVLTTYQLKLFSIDDLWSLPKRLQILWRYQHKHMCAHSCPSLSERGVFRSEKRANELQSSCMHANIYGGILWKLKKSWIFLNFLNLRIWRIKKICISAYQNLRVVRMMRCGILKPAGCLSLWRDIITSWNYHQDTEQTFDIICYKKSQRRFRLPLQQLQQL